MSNDQLAARLLAMFIGELKEQVAVMNAELLALERTPADPERQKALFRVAHTLKGAARASNVPTIEHVCHSLETLLAQARDGTLVLGPAEFSLLFTAADALSDAGNRLETRRDLSDSPLAALRDRLARPDAARPPGGSGPVLSRMAPSPGSSVGAASPDPSAPRSAPVSRARADREPAPEPTVRVEADKLDLLLAAAGQLLVAVAAGSESAADLGNLQAAASRTAAEWTHAARRVRAFLEVAGAPPPVVAAVNGVDEHVRRMRDETARLSTNAKKESRALARVASDVADGVRLLRLRPISDVFDALPRVVRDLAATGSKEAELVVEGGGVAADRGVLDGLREAVLQLVRNAVDHGIEPPADRLRLGKPRSGVIRVTAAMRGHRLVVSVADDGAGLDVAGIRRQMERQGRPALEDDQSLARALFAGGLSTREEVTAISGRGVGLDIVRTAVERVQGAVSVTWDAGRGATFTIECPPTLATVSAVLAEAGSQLLAIPTAHIDRMLRVPMSDIKRADARDVMVLRDEAPVPLVPLARLLPPLVERQPAGALQVVVLKTGAARLAVAVDTLVAEQDVVLRPIWRGRQALPFVSGAAILGSGRIALVLDGAAIIAAGLGASPGAGLATPLNAAKPARHRVLVVDDSITTRTLEQSILEAAGHDVATAVDGAEAWRWLQEHGADLVVADVEMPRMDGFGLCEAMRKSKRFREVPVILVTALESPEHRARGLEAGADAYLAKSTFDQQMLLDAIRQLLGEAGG